MIKVSVLLLAAVLVGATLLQPGQSRADYDNGPKPLTALTIKPTVTDPNAFPQELDDLRNQVQKEYNDWMAQDNVIDQQCRAARTPGERALCEQNKKASQARLDVVNADTRMMQWRIDSWSNKVMGRPPPPPPAPMVPTPYMGSGYAPAAPPAPKPLPVLIPQGDTPLPAGTF